MSGPAVIWTKVVEDAAVLARVEADAIVCGNLPLGTPPPGISIKQIGRAQRLNLSMTAGKWLMRARVTVRVISKDYREMDDVLELVRKALPNVRATVNGIEVESILPDVEGPDEESEEEGTVSRTQDYIVTFQAPSA